LRQKLQIKQLVFNGKKIMPQDIGVQESKVTLGSMIVDKHAKVKYTE